jgi:hypothetical protein
MQEMVDIIHRTGSIYEKRYIVDEKQVKDLNAAKD